MIFHLKTAAAGLTLGLTATAAALAQGDASPDPAGRSYSVLLSQGDMCELDFQGEGGEAGAIYATCEPGGYMSGRVASWSVEGGRVMFVPDTGAVEELRFFADECHDWTALEVGETASAVCWIGSAAASTVLSVTRDE